MTDLESASGASAWLAVNWLPLAGLLLNAVILPVVTGVYRQLRDLNGRLVRLEEWRLIHDRQDETRHQELVQNQRDIWSTINHELSRRAVGSAQHTD